MKETTFVSKRLTLNKEGRKIAKSWGRWWAYFGQFERTARPVKLLFGDWSGYQSSQYRITHVDIAYKTLPNDYRGTVLFSDGTTMAVWVKVLSRKEIIERRLYKNATYSELIHKLLKKEDNFYDVAKESRIEPQKTFA